jgi:sigma-B regulation protein RsbU (phosphoserine phosphatase)
MNILRKLRPETLHARSSVSIIVTVAILLELISTLQLQFAHRSIREEVLHRAEALTEDNTTNMFVTFFLGLVDLTTGHLHFCNAGHNPPVIGTEFLKTLNNVPIGVMPDYSFQGEEVDSIKQKPLFVYTDGLTEAENKGHELFGEDRMLDILRDAGGEDARQVIDTMVAAVEKHRNGAEPSDDLTMLYLRL